MLPVFSCPPSRFSNRERGTQTEEGCETPHEPEFRNMGAARCLADGVRLGERAASHIRELLALGDEPHSAVYILDIENEGIGILWPIELDTTQNHGQRITFVVVRLHDVRGTNIPECVALHRVSPVVASSSGSTRATQPRTTPGLPQSV